MNETNAQDEIAFLKAELQGIHKALTSEAGKCLRQLGQWALHPSTFGHQLAVDGEKKIKEWVEAYEEEHPTS